MTVVSAGESRLLPKAAAAIRTQIRLHGGNEVCFVCTVDEQGHVATARKVAAGDVKSVLALPGVADRGELLVHNHPLGKQQIKLLKKIIYVYMIILHYYLIII